MKIGCLVKHDNNDSDMLNPKYNVHTLNPSHANITNDNRSACCKHLMKHICMAVALSRWLNMDMNDQCNNYSEILSV
ncbi:hypothetical protein [Candidatus Hodgkinia cicadicola]|uniref:hypothetical protein n=1 Tax=Candidatus Hodgkinia cicadicola TaxID=573658 RepID=UPI0011BA9872